MIFEQPRGPFITVTTTMTKSLYTKLAPMSCSGEENGSDAISGEIADVFQMQRDEHRWTAQ
jgi:hypothetical protein